MPDLEQPVKVVSNAVYNLIKVNLFTLWHMDLLFNVIAV